MRLFTITLALLLAAISVFSQSSDKEIFVVTFSDKGPDILKSILAPENYLSEKANSRRQKHAVSFDESDLPLYQEYVSQVLSTGVNVLSRSRWLNCIVVEGTKDVQGKLNKIPGVKNVTILKTSGPPDHKNFDKKSIVALKEYNVKGLQKKANGSDVYNYGAAENQISMIKGQYLHNLNYCGQGMTIAVLDNGFNRVDILSAFDSLWINNQILGTKDFVTPGANVFDPDAGSHGTMVLSTMASNIPGTIVGTAPKADYWLIHTEDNAGESYIEEYYWVSGAEFADSVGADVINSSLGYTTFPNSPAYDHTYADMDGNTCVSTIGADMAVKKGILVVNSAGNSGENYDPWQYIGAPADGDSVFTIGAVDGTGIRASFSSKGPTYDGRIKPDIAAQGLDDAVFFWDNGTQQGKVYYGSGTSFSSPIIAGMSACLWQSVPDKSNMDIIQCLRATASNSQMPDTLVGWGIPDYEQARLQLSLGTPEIPARPGLKVFPNPFSLSFTAILPEALEGRIVAEIISPDGKIMISRHLDSSFPIQSLYMNDLTGLKAGIYILRVIDKNNVFTSTCIRY